MNPELLHLLAEAGIRRRLAWHDIVVLNNYGPVPVPLEWARDRNVERGLNFLILDGVRPTHFCKCRSADNSNLNWETSIRRSLSAVDAGLRVPSVEAATSNVLSVQTSRFLDGPHFGMIVPTQKPGTSMRNTSGTLNASQIWMKCAALSAASASRMPPACFGLFATMPAGRPPNRARHVMIGRASAA